MVPFRVYDAAEKKLWIVLNYHPSSNEYLVAQEDEGDDDGAMQTISASDLKAFRLVDFLDEAGAESY